MTTTTRHAVLFYRLADAAVQLAVAPISDAEIPEGYITVLVDTPFSLDKVPTPVLLRAYALAADKPEPKSFHTRAKGILQTFAALSSYAAAPGADQLLSVADDAATEASSSSNTPTMTTKTKKSTTKKSSAAKKSSGTRGRPARMAPDSVITVLVDKNPKRPGSAAHARFDFYRNGQTVAAFLAKGGWRADLNWDVKQRFIRVTPSSKK